MSTAASRHLARVTAGWHPPPRPADPTRIIAGHTVIRPGDRVVALGPTPIQSIGDFFKVTSAEKPSATTLDRPGSGAFTVGIDKLSDQATYEAFASPLADGETFVVREANANGQAQLAGLISVGPMIGSAMATLWDQKLNIVEVRITLNVPNTCTNNCALKNVALMDWNAKSWINPVSLIDVAWVVYPALNQPAPMMNVPAPVPVGVATTSTITGTFNAYDYGSYIYGTYSGRTSSYSVPQYEYTLTNVAMMHNLASAIQRDTIRQQNKLREDFVMNRVGNMRFGSLNPGERLLGYVFFCAPQAFGRALCRLHRRRGTPGRGRALRRSAHPITASPCPVTLLARPGFVSRLPDRQDTQLSHADCRYGYQWQSSC